MPNTYTDKKKNIIKDRIQCWREIEIDHKKLKVSAISDQRSFVIRNYLIINS